MTFESGRTVWIEGTAQGRWRLDLADLALRDMPVSLAIVFDGPADESALLAAIEAELTRYPVFQAMVREDSSNVWLQCGGKPRSLGIPVTIARSENAFTDRSADKRYEPGFVAKLLPPSTVRGPTGSLLAMQITVFPDACAIGLVWNHVVSDLHGIYGFLCDVFTRYCGAPLGVKPTFDRDAIWRNLAPGTPIADRVSRIARDGIVQISPLRARLAIPRYVTHALLDDVQLCLRFGAGDEVTGRSDDKLSANDLILANLLKIYDGVRPRDRREVALYFPISVRRLLGISGVAVANCIGNISMTFAREQLADSTILSLAEAIHHAVARYDLEQLRRDRMWAEHWRRHATASSVYHHWLFGARRLYSSSWMSGALTAARLGEARFLCLLRAPTLHRLPLPAFHSTAMPYRNGDTVERIVRIGLRRREAARLERILPAMPNVQRIASAALLG